MKRISTSTKVVDKFGAGKPGFTNGNVVSGVPSTDLEADWFDNVQEEICTVIEATGGVVDGSSRVQLLAALTSLYSPGRLLRVVVFTANGTWNAGAGTKSIEVELVGGGGGGGGSQATAATEFATGAGGGAGGYARKFMAAPVTAQTVTIGAGGASTAAATGSAGGTTSFGALLSATGGGGGGAGLASVSNRISTGGLGGIGVGGDINIPGPSAALSTQWASSGAALLNPSLGASSMFGAAAFSGAPSPGASRGYGAGGTGATNSSSAAAAAGVAGTSGIVIVKEYA